MNVRKCETCRWWEWGREIGPEDDIVQLGDCRRMPPQATWHADGSSTVLPVQTTDSQWCGEWAPKPDRTFDATAEDLARAVLNGTDLTAARVLADRIIELCQGE